MRKIVLVTLAVTTVLGSLASPSFAQQSSRDRGNGSSNGGDYYAGATKRKPVLIAHFQRKLLREKGGAYCSTNWYVLFDERGRRTDVRHCDDRRDIEIN